MREALGHLQDARLHRGAVQLVDLHQPGGAGHVDLGEQVSQDVDAHEQQAAREQEICRRLKPELLQRGLLLVGIDVLGDFLTEVNVTSPTGLVEIDELDRTSVEARVLEMTERLARSRA